MAAQVPTDEADGQHNEQHQAEVSQDEAHQHEGHQHEQHDPDEALHQADALWLSTSTLAARKETPARSPMAQVVATSSVTLTGVNSPTPLMSPATLTVITSRPAAPTVNRWTW